MYCDECGFAVSYQNDSKDFRTAIDFHEDSLCHKPLFHSVIESEDVRVMASMCDSHAYLLDNTHFQHVSPTGRFCDVVECLKNSSIHGVIKIQGADK